MSTPIEQYDACMELQRAGRTEEAVDGLKRLIETEPDFALAYNALGAIDKKRGDIDAAIQNAKKYCELAPDDAFGFTILSSYCIAANMRDEAEDALGRAQDLRLKEHFGG